MGMRSFIAVSVPQGLLDIVRRVQQDFRKSGFSFRWVKPEQTHLTLKFMADLSEADQPAVLAALTETCNPFPPFSLSFQGIGVFPNVRNPRVLWIGMGGDTAALIDLQQRVDRSIFEKTDHRVTGEDRPFKPHLTVARIQGRIISDHLVTELKRHVGLASEPFIVSELHWIESRLTPSGPIYRLLKSVNLNGS